MRHPRVVIIGAGFGGLQCARALARRPVDVLLLDRNNYHLFTPLLYQVASSLLNPSDIAQPIRAILRRAPNVHVRLAAVVGIDFPARSVLLADGESVSYDYLVIAAGSETEFFGDSRVEAAAFGLKDLPEAMELRNRVLRCFETAARTPEPAVRRPWLTFVVVGGGPTGVEYAGALSELVRLCMADDYPDLGAREVRIVLVEGEDRVLPVFRDALGNEAGSKLERRFGVDLRLGRRVERIEGNRVILTDGESIPTRTLVWAAGVRPSRLVERLEVPRTPTDRIAVDASLRVRGMETVFAIGDIAGARHGDGELPMLAAAAMQGARHVSGEIIAAVSGGRPTTFRYRDKGIMATIGRRAAVAQFGRVSLQGYLGWMAWLMVHLIAIIGFRNRLWVLAGWAWNYLRYDRPIRLLVRARDRRLAGNDGNGREE